MRTPVRVGSWNTVRLPLGTALIFIPSGMLSRLLAVLYWWSACIRTPLVLQEDKRASRFPIIRIVLSRWCGVVVVVGFLRDFFRGVSLMRGILRCAHLEFCCDGEEEEK